MKLHRTFRLSEIISICLVCLLLFTGGCKKIGNGMLIATEARLISLNNNSGTLTEGRFIPGSRIIVFHPGKPGSMRILTEDLHSAAFPEISYDGKHMLFTGQKTSGDPWQIWEMDLRNLEYRQITSFNENCTDPVYLPGGRFAFSKLTINDTVKSAHCLFTSNLDGTDIRQITFSPCDNYATYVLKDGRMLTVTRQLLPEKSDPILMVMRPDGTKADMFYMKKGAGINASDPRETDDGRILFIESEGSGNPGGKLVSISYKRPLHTRMELVSGSEEEFISVLPLSNDNYIVSYRKSGSHKFALYEYDPVKKEAGGEVFTDPDYDILDVVRKEPHERPKKLPSEVDMQVKTGLLLCQDINFTEYMIKTAGSGEQVAKRIEVSGVDTTYGIVPVEDDGSFQLKVLSDKPFRIRTLDENGSTVNGPCSWLWLRPNERRGCVGCHEDPEIVPVNRIPLAVKIPPVLIPVNISGIKEKTVELE